MKTGLTLGKYAPLHRGHQLVIETALAEMDETIALVYDAPYVTNVPLSVRSRWLRELYPALRVIEAWGPTETGYTAEIMRAHERYLIDTLGLRGITHFYSSEAYGEHVSAALGAIDRRVDTARRTVPISATRIREKPYDNRRFVDPLVYRDLITNVVFLGAPGSGKTTLAERLANEFATQWMPEYGREYWLQHQVNRRLTPEQLLAIAEEHIAREDALLLQARQYLFTDTSAITTATFGLYYHGAVVPRLLALAAAAASRYDLTFVCDIDFPCENTWDRSGEVQRKAFQQQTLADLDRYQVPFILLQGDLDTRVAQVRKVLARFHKYMDLRDLTELCTA